MATLLVNKSNLLDVESEFLNPHGLSIFIEFPSVYVNIKLYGETFNYPLGHGICSELLTLTFCSDLLTSVLAQDTGTSNDIM